MNGERSSTSFQVLLVSAPWALFHRPSIQLAALRSYLQKTTSVAVHNRHLSIDIAHTIGIDLYSRIARSGWAGDALFTPLAFPEKSGDAARLFRSEMQADGHGSVPDFDSLVTDIEQCCDTWVAALELDRFRLAGFSVCFNQLSASLYLAGRMKDQAAIDTVFGGSSCTGEAGAALIEQFGQIDYLVDGEGERPLVELCRYVDGQRPDLPAQIRTKRDVETGERVPDIERLDELPVPDYAPYIEEAGKRFGSLPFMPTLPVEFSRGCMWNRCTFCNLNMQWHGYRLKSSERMHAEVRAVSAAHESLNFAFTDNMLPPRELDTFFQAIAESLGDYSFFGEIRARTTPEQIEKYRQGGLNSVQVGIEALSDSLLSRMKKGTTVMDNVAVMKYCCAQGVLLQGNIITDFPQTEEDEIAETLATLDHIFPYPPLDAASFFLGFGSPVHKNSREYGIQAITVHPKIRMLFPESCRNGHLITGYRGDVQMQRTLWQPVREKIRRWQDFHRTRDAHGRPALSYRDGGDFLFLRQELPGKEPLIHRLRGLSRKIYLFCEQPKTLDEICSTFPKPGRESIVTFARQLHAKRLLFHDGERIISLAVRTDS